MVLSYLKLEVIISINGPELSKIQDYQHKWSGVIIKSSQLSA